MKAVTLELTLEEANLVLEALGAMPYVRVYELVAKIQTQAQSQLHDRGQPAAGEPSAIIEPSESAA